jgi:hypothetical protein
MATYKVKFITPEGELEVECDDDVYVLDAAELTLATNKQQQREKLTWRLLQPSPPYNLLPP